MNLTDNLKSDKVTVALPIQKKKEFIEISQSPLAIYIAVGIIFLFDILSVILLLTGNDDSPGITIIGTFWDIFFGIFLLLGRKWARTWTIIRTIIGFVCWGIISAISIDIGSIIIQAGFGGCIILLLTGKSTGLRIGSSIALLVISFLVGIIITAFSTLSSF